MLATAIHAGMKATDLKELDLAYAPPYSSAKDPVNMAGYMIENIENKIFEAVVFGKTSKNLPRDGSVTLLDVRTEGEYAGGHLEGFRNIPVDVLREHLDEIEKRKPVYVICQSGLRSYVAARILTGNGYDAYNFSGGFRFLRKQSCKIVVWLKKPVRVGWIDKKWKKKLVLNGILIRR